MCRKLEADMKRMKNDWKQLGGTARDSLGWRMLVDGLCNSAMGTRRK